MPGSSSDVRLFALALGRRVPCRLMRTDDGPRVEFIGGPVSDAVPLVIECRSVGRDAAVEGRDDAAKLAATLKGLGYDVTVGMARPARKGRANG